MVQNSGERAADQELIAFIDLTNQVIARMQQAIRELADLMETPELAALLEPTENGAGPAAHQGMAPGRVD